MNIEDGGGIDWESEMDRLLVMQMMIKMADINTPTKSFELHRLWSKRITEEFYQQVGVLYLRIFVQAIRTLQPLEPFSPPHICPPPLYDCHFKLKSLS